MRPRLALVPGEPAGIGPELCILAAQRHWDADLVAFADHDTLRRAAATLALPITLLPADAATAGPGELRLVNVANAVPVQPGLPEAGNAKAVVAALLDAAQGCLDGRFDGIVTGPVNKATINEGGIAYSGTTELLAGQAGSDVVMMLANPTLRVALATTHLPLREVPDAITDAGLSRVLRIVAAGLRNDFGIPDPTIAVLGLNPHAGESGHLGDEELRIIEPLLQRLRAEGMHLVGPLPADTAFLPGKLKGFDAVLAMYHDQGLPVLKYSGFEQAVNITLGLPYPRVAVDHGTALDLAGSGRADPSSLFAAITHCTHLARQRHGARAGAAPGTARP